MSTVVLAALLAHVNSCELEILAEVEDRDIDGPIPKNSHLTQEWFVA